MKNWEVLTVANGDIHVIPLDDIIEHTTDGLSCACQPELDDDEYAPPLAPSVIVHNAIDGREEHERTKH